MDIRVGGSPALGSPAEKTVGTVGFIEGKVLAVRPPRRRRDGPPHDTPERREGSAGTDPTGGRVVILLIPDACQLPQGLETGAYRVFLRFTRK